MWCDRGVSDRRQIDILLKMQKMHFFLYFPLSSMQMSKKKSSYLIYTSSVTVLVFFFKCVDLLAWLSVACADNSSCWCFFCVMFCECFRFGRSMKRNFFFFSSVCVVVVVVVARLLELSFDCFRYFKRMNAVGLTAFLRLIKSVMLL